LKNMETIQYLSVKKEEHRREIRITYL